MGYINFINPEHFLLSTENFKNFLQKEIIVKHNWSDDVFLNNLNYLGKEYFGSTFNIQNHTILNNRNAYLGYDESNQNDNENPYFNGLKVTNKVQQLAEDNNIWNLYKSEISRLTQNINQFKFHLQGNLDLHFINAIHLKKGMFNEASFRLKRFAASNFISTLQDFTQFYKTGFLDFSNDKTNVRRYELILKELPTAFYENLCNEEFFSLALITPEFFDKYPFLSQYEGLDYFHPFRVNRPLASYFTLTEKLIPLYSEFMDDITYQAYLKTEDVLENFLRQKLNLPYKNESWISEVMLLRTLERELSSLTFIHQAKFGWLGRQSLDIYIIEKKIALEYQGVQHFRSVDYFGGQVALNKTKIRDKRKIDLCLENGISLIHVLPNYDLKEILEVINDSDNRKTFYARIGEL